MSKKLSLILNNFNTEVFNLWSADPWGSAGSFKGVHGQVKKSSVFFLYKVLLSLVDWLAFS